MAYVSNVNVATAAVVHICRVDATTAAVVYAGSMHAVANVATYLCAMYATAAEAEACIGSIYVLLLQLTYSEFLLLLL